jgi:hypothetical protein
MSFELNVRLRHRSEAAEHGAAPQRPKRYEAVTTAVAIVLVLGIGHFFGVDPADVLRAID